MATVGYATLDVIPSVKGIAKELEKQTGAPLEAAGKRGGEQFGASAGKSAGARFGSVFKTAAKATLLGVAGLAAGAIKVGIDSVNLAADFEQSVGAVDAIFKKSSKRIHAWADDAADDVGLTANQFNELGTLIGAQLKNGGTAMNELAPKTKELIGLGADLSSMFGGETKDAVEALSSALKGERDPIEKYGVSLNQAKIDAEAAALGFKKVDGALSGEAQQAATLSLIMKQTADAHGNFAREADTLSGKQQRLKARLTDVKTEIGTALLPIMTDAADFLLEKGVPAFERFSDWFAGPGIDGIQKFGGFARDEVLPIVEDLGEFLKKAAGFGGDLVEALNDLPKPAKYAALTALLGGGAALKLRGGGGGALGTVGKAFGLAKPVPVFVTNKGFGGDVVGGSAGKSGKVASGLKTGAKAAPIIGAVVVGYELGGDKFAKGARGSGILGMGDIKGLKERADAGAKTLDESYGPVMDRLRDKAAGLGDELDLVGARKVNPDLAIPKLPAVRASLERFYELEVQAGRPISPDLKILGYQETMDKLYRLQQLKIGDKEFNIHVTRTGAGEADYLSGGLTPRANGGSVDPRRSYLVGERGPEIFRPTGAGSIVPNHELGKAGGVNFNGPIHVEAHDYRDFMGQLQRKAQQAQLDGVRSGR